jgi:anti-sigma factor RsiW
MNVRGRRDAEALSAYHDGELRGWARWRFERRLRRDPDLRRELELLRRLGQAVRERGAAATEVDLWDRIALRLPAADATRQEARARGPRRAAWWLGAPLGAAAAAAIAGVAILSWLGPSIGPADGVVRWVYAGRRNVFVLETPGAPGTTIIWVLDDGPKQTARRRSGGVV